MIGTIIIAIIGYGVAAFFAIGCCGCVVMVRRSSRRGDEVAAADFRGRFLVGVFLALGFAILTRWLTGGQF